MITEIRLYRLSGMLGTGSWVFFILLRHNKVKRTMEFKTYILHVLLASKMENYAVFKEKIDCLISIFTILPKKKKKNRSGYLLHENCLNKLTKLFCVLLFLLK